MLAVLPDGSVYVYVTGVVPTLKKEFGNLVLDTRVAVPELSVAEGSCQLTVVPGDPDGTVTVMSLIGEILGGIVSAADSTGKKKESFNTNSKWKMKQILF